MADKEFSNKREYYESICDSKKCASCKKNLSDEDLEKVTGGNRWDGLGGQTHMQGDKVICTKWYTTGWLAQTCNQNQTVDGVANVCTCQGRKDGHCCYQYGDNCTCSNWIKELHICRNEW